MSMRQKQKLFIELVVAMNSKITVSEAGTIWHIMYK